MANNDQQPEKPELGERALKAQKEFSVILDVLLVPLRADISNQRLLPHRGWRGGCLLVLTYPDLVPVNPDPQGDPTGYCREFSEVTNELVFGVENMGDAPAPPSVTRVTFSPKDVSGQREFDLPTKEIPAGGSVEVGPFKYPEECLGKDCEFVIKVDAKDEVVESNEANNTDTGKCAFGLDSPD